MPTHTENRADAVRLIDALLRSKGRERDRARWAIRYWFTHVSTTDTDVRFYLPSELQRFVGVFLPALRLGRWRVSIRKSQSRDWPETLAAWRLPKQILVERNANDARAPERQKFGIASLRLRHADEQRFTHRSKMDIRKWSSSALRFAVHMAAFELLTDDDIYKFSGARDTGANVGI